MNKHTTKTQNINTTQYEKQIILKKKETRY